MLVLGYLIFRVPASRMVLIWVNETVLGVLAAGHQGALFVLGPLAVGPGQSTAAGEPSVGFVLAAQVLPAVVFFAALMAVLYHLRVLQPVVRLLARFLPPDARALGRRVPGGRIEHLRRRGIGHGRAALPESIDPLRAADSHDLWHVDRRGDDSGALRPVPPERVPADRRPPHLGVRALDPRGCDDLEADPSRDPATRHLRARPAASRRASVSPIRLPRSWSVPGTVSGWQRGSRRSSSQCSEWWR